MATAGSGDGVDGGGVGVDGVGATKPDETALPSFDDLPWSLAETLASTLSHLPCCLTPEKRKLLATRSSGCLFSLSQRAAPGTGSPPLRKP